jgi:hypothetical protein
VIADALAYGIPVIVGVNALNLPAFHQFSQSLAVCLPCETNALADWVAGLGSGSVHAA